MAQNADNGARRQGASVRFADLSPADQRAVRAALRSGAGVAAERPRRGSDDHARAKGAPYRCARCKTEFHRGWAEAERHSRELRHHRLEMILR